MPRKSLPRASVKKRKSTRAVSAAVAKPIMAVLPEPTPPPAPMPGPEACPGCRHIPLGAETAVSVLATLVVALSAIAVLSNDGWDAQAFTLSVSENLQAFLQNIRF